MTREFATARHATALTILGVLSPIAGLLLEILLAWRYGASGTIDALRIALLLLLLGNQLFVSNLIPNALVPVLADFRQKNAAAEGWRVVFNIAGLFAILLAPLSIWAWVAPGDLASLLGPGLSGSARLDAMTLIRVFAFALVLMLVSGAIGSILTSYRIFWLPACGQLLTNLAVIICIVGLGRWQGAEVLASGWLAGTVLVFGLHTVILAQLAKTENVSLWWCLGPADRGGLKMAFWLLLPLAAMIILSQWIIVITNRTLSEMPTGQVAVYGYAFKMLALATLLPAVLSTIVMPAFSEAGAANDRKEFRRLLARATRMAVVVTVPAAVCLLALRIPLTDLLFNYGAMKSESVRDIADLFGILVVATPIFALTVIFERAFYALKRGHIPMIVLFGTAIVATFTIPMAGSLGGTPAIAGVWMAIGLLRGGMLGALLWRTARSTNAPPTEPAYLGPAVVSISLASGGICGAVMLLSQTFGENGIFSLAAVQLLVSVPLAAVAGYALGRKSRNHEVRDLIDFLKWQVGRIFKPGSEASS